MPATLACDPTPYLKVPKHRKFMGLQDELAVVAAGRALESAGLGGVGLGERTGLYLVVGHIPFEQTDIDALLAASLDDGSFSMQRFSTAGFRAVNGLLTFRCLPNMPAFHISVNFDVQGPYFVSYPGPGQFYLALDEAVAALASGSIDMALAAGVAHQRNYLVEHHFGRLACPVPAERLCDAAGCLVLETASHARARSSPVRGRLLECEIGYRPHDSFDAETAPVERWSVDLPNVLPHGAVAGSCARPKEYASSSLFCDFHHRRGLVDLGPASLPAVLSAAASGPACRMHHRLVSRDGIQADSTWQLPSAARTSHLAELVGVEECPAGGLEATSW